MELCGKNPVLERIKVRPDTIEKLYLQRDVNLSEIVKAANASGVHFESKDKNWFKNEFKEMHTQGVVAFVKEFVYTDYQEVISDCLKEKSIPVFLDNVTDPQNLGAIIRILACIGGYSIVIPEHGSSQVNSTVLRVANGGENYLKIAKVINIATSLKKIQDKGVVIFGTTVDGKQNVSEIKIVGPSAIVMGSEGKGIRPGIDKLLDNKVYIEMKGAPLSFNVAIATSIVCYEIMKKR